jgi:integrase
MSTEKIYNNLLAQLDRLFRHNRQGSYKTRQRYYEAMKRFCRFLAEYYRTERLANIGPKHIESYANYMKAKGLSASTIKTDLAAIRFWHDQMPNIRHTLPKNQDLKLERRRFGQVDRTWSNAEFNKMIAVCWEHEREDYAAIICLARYAGLRIHECFRIDTATAEHAVRNMQIIIKGKGGKIRTVPIQDSIRIELEKMLAVTERGHKLFVPKGVPTHVAIEDLQRFIRTHRDEVRDPDSNRPMTFHGLRHTCAVEWYQRLIGEGETEFQARKQVSSWLGHERDEITRIYLASLEKDDLFGISDGHRSYCEIQ